MVLGQPLPLRRSTTQDDQEVAVLLPVVGQVAVDLSKLQEGDHTDPVAAVAAEHAEVGPAGADPEEVHKDH